MRAKVVAVVPPSLCKKCGKDSKAFPFCTHCGKLLSFSPQVSYFDLFGVQISLVSPVVLCKAKYYEWIKELHPDRFIKSSDEEKRQSLLWSTQLNSAYKTFSNEGLFQEYVLKLLGLKLPEGKNTLPHDLLDLYFEYEENHTQETKEILLEALEKKQLVVRKTLEESNKEFLIAPSQKHDSIKRWLDAVALGNYLQSMKEALVRTN